MREEGREGGGEGWYNSNRRDRKCSTRSPRRKIYVYPPFFSLWQIVLPMSRLRDHWKTEWLYRFFMIKRDETCCFVGIMRIYKCNSMIENIIWEMFTKVFVIYLCNIYLRKFMWYIYVIYLEQWFCSNIESVLDISTGIARFFLWLKDAISILWMGNGTLLFGI